MKNLLLLHGALGARSQFDAWKALLEPHYRVYTLDFEGHGSSPFADRPFRIEHFAENLQVFLDAEELNGVDIFGYSMGGYVAMHLAAQNPAAVGRIFTFATKLAWSPETSAKEVKMLNADKIMEKVPKFAAMLEARHHGNEWREHLARTAEMMLDLGDQPRLTPEVFAALQHRIRMGVGDRDHMVSIEETVGAYRHLPHGELFVMPDTPHPLEKIDAARMVAAMREFFN